MENSIEYITLILPLVSGILMGYGYFYGLWWTVQRLAVSSHPHRLMLGSFFLRLLLVMVGFYLLLQWGWQVIAIALVGFIAVRMVVIRRWGLQDAKKITSMEKTNGV